MVTYNRLRISDTIDKCPRCGFRGKLERVDDDEIDFMCRVCGTRYKAKLQLATVPYITNSDVISKGE